MKKIILLLILSSCSSVQERGPYVWLEEIQGTKALNWSKEQSEKTYNNFSKDPKFNQIYRNTENIISSKERIPFVTMRGNYLYNFHQDKQNPKGIWRRTKLRNYLKTNPEWEILLDIDKLAKKERHGWSFSGANCLPEKYQRCLIMLSMNGQDATQIREFDLRKKTFVNDGFFIPQAKNQISWINIDTIAIASDWKESTLTNSGYPRVLKVLKRGQDLKNASYLDEVSKDDVSISHYTDFSTEDPTQIIVKSKTFYKSSYLLKYKNKFEKIEVPEDIFLHFNFNNKLIFELKSPWQGIKEGSLIAINKDDLFSKIKKAPEVIFSPDKSKVLYQVSRTKDAILIVTLNNVKSELNRYKYKYGKWESSKIPIPVDGEISISSTSAENSYFFASYESFLTPRKLFLVNFRRRVGVQATAIKSLPSFFNSQNFIQKQNWATSKDGTKVPYFIIYHKDINFDGSNPTLVYGYGGFKVSLTPWYSGTLGKNWLENKGVFVLANIRGGEEFGPNWHKAGLKVNRQIIFDDFIAICEDLVKRNITNPNKIGIKGESNGGLLVSTVMVQRPDLLKAVHSDVPLTDMLRYHKLLAGASWIGEYGNPEIEKEAEYLKSYSPFENVDVGRDYPEVLITTSTNDDRVHPAHARKLAFKMIKQDGKVYYFENFEGGHSGNSDLKVRAKNLALSYYFFNKVLMNSN